jgi:opacity protein-like surface antigen
VVAPSAVAEPYYLGLQGEYTRPTEASVSNDQRYEASSERGFAGSLFGGFELADWAALEGEAGWRRIELHGFNNEIDALSADGHQSLWYGLASVVLYLPLRLLRPVRPYATAGIGPGYWQRRGRVTSTGASLDGTGWCPARQAGVGLSITIADRWLLRTGYRYFACADIDQHAAIFSAAWRFH